ncbi:MAG: S-methyl-5-thioribose-1-phosphate isomerase [Eubacteriales bacterium]|nr:S-methyl-5-thioribose-1-phosphate isomerase [Eubacteriales bacterium]
MGLAGESTNMDHVRLSDDGKYVVILDQSKLPSETEYRTLKSAEDIYEAIFRLRVRGAPAIGICAGYGMYCLAQTIHEEDYETFKSRFVEYGDYLNGSRPTAVNLSWAIKRMTAVVEGNSHKPVKDILPLLERECRAIHQEDIRMCRAISEFGLSLIKDGDGILTHCNAGPLATSRYGTALGPLILGKERGMEFHVFADETRPLLQGARLTAYELVKAGIDVTLICDNMAGTVMKNGWVSACFVGCDRVAANGDTANKIGTSVVAVLAKYYGIPFYVLGPTSTIDMECASGEDIEIEERDPDEIKKMFYQKPMALEEVKCYNPAFDVTDHSLISGIITEKGICRPPYEDSLKALFIPDPHQL